MQGKCSEMGKEIIVWAEFRVFFFLTVIDFRIFSQITDGMSLIDNILIYNAHLSMVSSHYVLINTYLKFKTKQIMFIIFKSLENSIQFQTSKFIFFIRIPLEPQWKLQVHYKFSVAYLWIRGSTLRSTDVVDTIAGLGFMNTQYGYVLYAHKFHLRISQTPSMTFEMSIPPHFEDFTD